MPKQRPSILVVDDHADVVDLFAEWLADLGAVHTATSSGQALAIADVVCPAILVTDIRLPRMDGFVVFRTLHAQQPDVRPVFITAYPSPTVLDKAHELDAPLLEKPVDRETLRTTVLAALGTET